MLELDLILLPFLDNIFPSLTEQQQLLFEKLLECEDQDMFQWFLRKSDPEEADILTIVNIIRQNTGIQPE
jgi:Uncharacterized conserved protein